jgi:hypothetical protein
MTTETIADVGPAIAFRNGALDNSSTIVIDATLIDYDAQRASKVIPSQINVLQATSMVPFVWYRA